MARASVAAYLRYGYDPAARRYYGCVTVEDGSPDLGPRATPYQPGQYADLWRPLFPAHDYPMALAQTCVHLCERTGNDVFAEAIERWGDIVHRELPANSGAGAYAEMYGRCIRFLVDAARTCGHDAYLKYADLLIWDAVDMLYCSDGPGMFAGHPGEARYDAVDGVGWLVLAIIHREMDAPLDYLGSGM